ncbi:MAG: NYN domain-containing protein [Anaerolineae bacterium]
MPVLIDGHNLIGQLATPSLEDPDDEEALLRILMSYRGRTGRAITVVFDPGSTFALASTQKRGGVKVVFAGHNSSADAYILRRVRQSRDRRGWLVVTSDRDLADAVRELGARIQSASDFAKELAAPAASMADWREKPLSPDEVDAWLAVFRDPSEAGPSGDE